MTIHLHLKKDLSLESLPQGGAALQSPKIRCEWKHPAAKQILDRLAKGASEDSLSDEYLDKGADITFIFFLLQQLKDRSLLSYTLVHEEKPLLTLIPEPQFQFKESGDPTSYFLSRFAFLRSIGETLFLESPLSLARIQIQDPLALSLLHTLSTPSSDLMRAFATFLKRASFLSDVDPSLESWEFHDLLFHTRSRKGRHSYPYGGTFRFWPKAPPSPALRPPPPSLIALYRPDEDESPSLFQVLEKRRSLREPTTTPLSSQQLGAFLYHSARVQKVIQGKRYDQTLRPSPGGGACHELELYLLLHQCEGFARGLYRYHPDSHSLAFCQEWNGDLQELFQSTAEDPPQVLILIAARFHRVNWKYESIAYATILKNAGALIQTMYLVATALELAPCAIGGGNSDLFSKAAHLNYFEETTVAEFTLRTSASK